MALAVPLAPPPGLRLPPTPVPVAKALSETTALALPLSVGERDSEGLAEAEAQPLVEGVKWPERVVQAVALAQALMLALKQELEDALGLLVLLWDAEVLGVCVMALPVGAPGVPLPLPHCVGVAERERRALRLAKGQGLAEREEKALPLLLGELEMQLERLGDGEGVALPRSEGEALGEASGDKVAVEHCDTV